MMKGEKREEEGKIGRISNIEHSTSNVNGEKDKEEGKRNEYPASNIQHPMMKGAERERVNVEQELKAKNLDLL
jgi:hypothetical protein